MIVIGAGDLAIESVESHGAPLRACTFVRNRAGVSMGRIPPQGLNLARIASF